VVDHQQRLNGSVKDMKKKETKNDVLVLTRDHLERLYGPSLATLSQFIADDAHTDPQAQEDDACHELLSC
jgi:hypothetical protein